MPASRPIADTIAATIADALNGGPDIGSADAELLPIAAPALGARSERTTAVPELGPTQGISSRFVPLWPSGFAVDPGSLDFGTLNTKEGITNASRFARLVNAVPAANLEYWAQTGSTTWDIWSMVLDNIELPSDSLGYAEINRLKSEMAISQKLDLLGQSYYFTDYWPAKFWEKANDASWRPLSLQQADSSGGSGPRDLLTLAQGDAALTANLTQIQLLRSWWGPRIFESPNWRLRPGSLASALSDGKTPASGSMPLFASALVIAKDVAVKIKSDSSNKATLLQAAQAATDLSFGPFALKGRPTQATAIAGAPDMKLDIAGDSLQAPGMQIIGFMCSVLPQCPNPSPNLYWGSSGSIQVQNKGGFFARFSVEWQEDSRRPKSESGRFPILTARVLSIPAKAREIVVAIEIMTFPWPAETWSTVSTIRFDNPVTKSYELSGTTASPSLTVLT